MSKVDTAIRIAWASLGLPYRWGGDDPVAGYDCSGFVIEVLRSVGVLPLSGDWSAAQLGERFDGVEAPTPGCLVLWGVPAHHVELYLGDGLSIGASGGGANVRTPLEASERNAYVRVRPIHNRGVCWFVDPFAGEGRP